jgi:hypothetical protein
VRRYQTGEVRRVCCVDRLRSPPLCRNVRGAASVTIIENSKRLTSSHPTHVLKRSTSVAPLKAPTQKSHPKVALNAVVIVSKTVAGRVGRWQR